MVSINDDMRHGLNGQSQGGRDLHLSMIDPALVRLIVDWGVRSEAMEANLRHASVCMTLCLCASVASLIGIVVLAVLS